MRRYMVILKADRNTESGAMPSAELIAAMGRYNEELMKAGVLLAGDGLHASSKGARVKYHANSQTVTDGPFAETKELIAGYWMLQVRSKEEAIEWAKRVPFHDGEEVEVRLMVEASDFAPDVMTFEEVAREESLREELRKKAQKS